MTRETNRREFLKTTATAGTLLAAGSVVGNAFADRGDTIKVGVIGCGGRGSGAAEDVLRAAPNVKIVALGDVFKSNLDGCRENLVSKSNDAEIKKLGNGLDLPDERCFIGLDAFEKVLKCDINYVILATPPGFRPLHIQAAVAAGKHIFCEKPVGVDGPGIRKVLAAYDESKQKNLRIVAGTQRRHQTGYLETMKRVHDGAIGDIVAARCHWDTGAIWFRNRMPEMSDVAYQIHNWYHFLWLCGDHIVEQHVHNLDVCNWAFNSHPKRCVGMGSRILRAGGDPQVVGNIYNFFSIDFEYPNGVHMLSTCRQIDRCDGNGVSEALVGTKGKCQVNAFDVNGERVFRGRTREYVQEHTDLIDCIRNNKPINELKNVAESTLTAIMGRMSAYTGKAVTWEMALNSKEDTMPANLSWGSSVNIAAAPVPGKTQFV